VNLPEGNVYVAGQVKRWKRGTDDLPISCAHTNPILDTHVCEVEMPDGGVVDYAANVIAKCMYAQCDAEGNQFLMLEALEDHKCTDDVMRADELYVEINGKQHIRKSTHGWLLSVQWKDGSSSWETLADVKELYPVQCAEYAVAKRINKEPAFVWWVPYTLNKRDHIIAAVASCYHKRTHKYGFCVPKTVQEAIMIDCENGNTLWQDAIKKEMSAVGIAFCILTDDKKILPSYQQIKCHLIFDIKMEDFKRKARYVAGGHMMEALPVLTYASVVLRDTVRIALKIAALHDLQVKTSDIQNAYLTAPVSEKIWVICGPEFSSNAGKRALIVYVLYGLKSAGAAFHNHLANCMQS
jgi:Reverse transcriptase (RNA-dependent DNA polymerase)